MHWSILVRILLFCSTINDTQETSVITAFVNCCIARTVGLFVADPELAGDGNLVIWACIHKSSQTGKIV